MRMKKSLIILILTFLLSLIPSLSKADYYGNFGVVPYGPFPSDYTFDNIWGISASQGVVYMAHKNPIDYKNTFLVSFDNGKKMGSGS